MKRLFFALLFSLPILAQDCRLPLGLITSAPTNVGPFDNRVVGCNTWIIDYNSNGFSALSLVVQTAPNDTGGVPGAWSTFTAVTGINPNTATTQATSTFGGTSSYFPWLRVQLTSATGIGSISGILYGWKVPAAPPSTGGCVGTSVTPCVVDGPNAAGTAPTFPPVLGAGIDGTNVRTVLTDTSGRQRQVGAAATGAAIAGDPVNVGTSDGVNILQPFICTQKAFANLSGSGDTQVIAATALQSIRICEVYFSTTASEDIKLTTGTGSNCGTGTADLSPLFKSVQSGRITFNPGSVVAPVATALCFNQSAAQANGVWITYAKF